MIIKTSWLILLVGVGVPAALSSPEISDNWNNASELREQRKEQAQQDRLANMHAAQAQEDSKIALARVKAGCIAVVHRETGGDTRLAEGVRVKAATDSPIDLDEGLVCTKSGDTAEVWGGRVAQVKRIGPAHAEEYSSYFSRLLGAY